MSRAGKPGQDDPESPGDFMARWSRRKIQARDEAARPDDPAAGIAQPPVAEADASPVCQPEQELTDADMPPVETLGADSDYAPFMSPGVSDGLRQRALRILFSQPACNITDGLNDYDDDYTQFAGLGSLVTHEMKRMLKRELAAEKNRQQQSADQAQESRAVDADVPVDASREEAQPAASDQADTEAVDDVAEKGSGRPGVVNP
ncbi:MAG TPA: DUF3306 domain-containing protein [Gammaproteobacteria bacterium]|nr:DUF3306 domain-containing protein [Gammaproteobacteria bacterium]